MINFEKIKRIYRFYFKNPPKAKMDINLAEERHGSVYGGWNIEKDSLKNTSIVYSVGIGEDISFDISVIAKYNCFVHGLDPTPRVFDWIKSQKENSKFLFYPVALSDKDGELIFYAPVDPKNISHTSIPVGNTTEVKVQGNKLSTFMKKLGHTEIDLLKIDIEGFEYQVIQNILDEKIYPKQLLVEFHHFFPNVGNRPTEQMIEVLKDNGYKLFSISDSFCEYSFKYMR